MSESTQHNLEAQAFFRDVNQRIAGVGEELFGEDEAREFLCECGRLECSERFSLTYREYRQVRESQRRFIVVPEHDDAAVESVVDRREAFWVVETFELPPASHS